MIGFRGDRVWGFLFRLHESGIGFVGRNLGIAVLVLSRLGSCIPPFSVCSRGLFVPRVGHECLHGVYIEPKRLCRLGTFGAQGILVESSHCGQEAKTLNPKNPKPTAHCSPPKDTRPQEEGTFDEPLNGNLKSRNPKPLSPAHHQTIKLNDRPWPEYLE